MTSIDAPPRRPTTPGPPARRPAPDTGRSVHKWARWLHVYSSMIALLIVLFFGITGVTLNHPSFTFGEETATQTTNGTLAAAATDADGDPNWLPVVEELRADYGVKGEVSDFYLTDHEATVTFANPGYSAVAFFDVTTAEFELTVTQQGFVAVMNDLHKGRDSGSAWRWVIDVSGIFLVVISITGIVMQFFLRKRRTSAFVTAGAGAVLCVALMWITLS